MQLRTPEEFLDRLCEKWSWRHKELEDLHFDLKSAQGSKVKSRILVVFLCAHFEGFLRDASDLYLNYVCAHNKQLKDLKDNFLAVHLNSIMSQALQSNKISVHTNLVRAVLDAYENDCFNVRNEFTQTHSNPSSAVFEEIVNSLGLDFSKFAVMRNLIDRDLLEQRHSVAHGEKRDIDFQSANDLYDKILEIIQNFSDKLLDSVIKESYSSNTKSKTEECSQEQEIKMQGSELP